MFVAKQGAPLSFKTKHAHISFVRSKLPRSSLSSALGYIFDARGSPFRHNRTGGSFCHLLWENRRPPQQGMLHYRGQKDLPGTEMDLFKDPRVCLCHVLTDLLVAPQLPLGIWIPLAPWLPSNHWLGLEGMDSGHGHFQPTHLSPFIGLCPSDRQAPAPSPLALVGGSRKLPCPTFPVKQCPAKSPMQLQLLSWCPPSGPFQVSAGAVASSPSTRQLARGFLPWWPCRLRSELGANFTPRRQRGYFKELCLRIYLRPRTCQHSRAPRPPPPPRFSHKTIPCLRNVRMDSWYYAFLPRNQGRNMLRLGPLSSTQYNMLIELVVA